jgi:hypothetical protein
VGVVNGKDAGKWKMSEKGQGSAKNRGGGCHPPPRTASFSSKIDGGLLSARDHLPLWFTSGKFCWGAVNFPNHSRIPLKDTKAVILTALKRLCLP